jgi:RNA polymerase sigma-70 factor (ECF subfamily)
MTPAAPPPPDEPQALMLAFQGGDEAAFDRLVEITKNEVVSLAYRYGFDAMGADDLAQETFLRVYRSRAAYKPEARFRAWLLRIATNLAISEARSRKRARALPLERPPEPGEPEDAGRGDLHPDPRADRPEAGMEREELGRAIEDAVRALPDTQRAAIVLNRFHEQSYEEVGATLGMSVEAVKSLLFRARQNLKDKLGKYLCLDPADEAPAKKSSETSRREAR